MERNTRKVYKGTVSSDKMEKTIVVVVETYKKDRLYGKRFKQSKKFHVHDELNQAHVGDFVLFIETRPLSKTKSFRLIKVLEKAVII